MARQWWPDHPSPIRSLLVSPTFQLRLALIVVGVFCMIRAVRFGIEREPLPHAIGFLTDGVSISVYAIAWAVAGLVAFGSIPKAWPGGSFGCILLSLAFAFGYTVSWLTAGQELTAADRIAGVTDYVNASNYWTVLLLLGIGYFPFRLLLAHEARLRSEAT